MKAFVILICALFGAASAQEGCGIVGVEGDTVQMDSVLETTPGGTTIWRADTLNVVSAASVAHPYSKYLTGLRYPTRYEYAASEIFPDFIKAEHDTQITRNVVFTCADGSTKPYTFLLSVVDENTEAPHFGLPSYTATVSLSDPSTDPHSANIVVSDGDYEWENAQLIVRSSNAMVTPFVDPIWTGEHPDPYVYQIDFFVSKDMTPGTYDVIFTADDGKQAHYTVLSLTVTA